MLSKAPSISASSIHCRVVPTGTERGTPQGGSISPLLMNVALHGMEEHLGVPYDRVGGVSAKSPYVVVRYAEDCVVMARSKASCQAAAALLNEWLARRGLRLSSEKTCTKTPRRRDRLLGCEHQDVQESKATKRERSAYKTE